ncbi:MAG: metalloprotease TldD [Robiginitomaculum sp.]|nr:metalloprotease TldD [Robiginitomaculum sp.]MDQ7078159.1 metalloprotease TldD [Robiginitomaculum sp.]
MTNPVFEDTDLDLAQASSLTEDALNGADDGEMFAERSVSESFVFDDGRLKNASYDATRGFGLRRVTGEKTGYAHSTELSPAAMKRAANAVRAADRGASGIWADAPHRTNAMLYGDADPADSPSFTEKTELLARIDAYVRAQDPRVIQVSASLSGEQRHITILRPGMDPIFDCRPLVRIGVAVTVEENGRRENGHAGAGGRTTYEQWITPQSWQSLADEALRQALVNLQAVDCPAGEMDVVLGPGWPGILLHEAIGHGLEGDFNRKGESAFSGRIGERVAAKGVTVVDDGSIAERRGSLTVDDEGTPTRPTTLIEDGILVGYMQDRQNARLMGMEPTGNGRRESFSCPPLPRMTNTFMRAGEHDPDEILASLKDGIYAVNFGGGQVDITSGKFVFQCTEAYLVKNGKIGAPVKGATLIGDGPSVLTRVQMIGNDFSLDPGIGVCGKAGQGVPVGVGQPTIKVASVTVGGADVG